jgi:hypothetical protein
MDKAEYWTTKSPLAEYRAVTFEHPAFDAPFRLVADQFAPVTLGGQVFTPAPMTIKPPDQTGEATPRLQIAFPRYVVGRQFKRQLGLIRAAGSRAPIEVTFEVYLGGNLSTPAVSWRFYAADPGGVTFTATAVQVNATDDNPMRRNVAEIYDPSVFTGLELI